MPCTVYGDSSVGGGRHRGVSLRLSEPVGVFSVLEMGAQETAGMRRAEPAYLLWRTSCHHIPSRVASLRSKIDQVIGALDDLHVVLDDEQ